MTIQEFLNDPLPFNRALTVRLINHALKLHKTTTGETLEIENPLLEEYGEDWFKKEFLEMVASFDNSSLEELNKATDLMISGWQRAVIMQEIEKRNPFKN